MKTTTEEQRKLYFSLLDNYLSGNGIDFKANGMNKLDILNFSSFCLAYVRKETADLIILAVIHTLLDQIN